MLVLECFLLSRAGVFPLLQPSAYVLEVFKKVKSRWVPRALLLSRLVLGFWAQDWGSLSGLLGKVWAVLESLESLFPAASFGTCVELGNEKCSFHGESGLKLLDMGWLLGDAHVCGEQFGDAEEGRLCAYFLCHNIPGLYRCRTSGADGGNHGLAVRIA